MRRGAGHPAFFWRPRASPVGCHRENVTMADVKRSDFIFTIGYQGDTAIVDGSARKRFGAMNATQLLEEGLYRSAFCAALYDGELDKFLPLFREATEIDMASIEGLQRMYGVFGTPETVTKVSVVS